MRFLINSAEEVVKSPLFRILAIVSVIATTAAVLTDGEPFSSSEVVIWAWAAEFYHLGIWSARLLCPGAAAAFALSMFLQKRGKKDE